MNDFQIRITKQFAFNVKDFLRKRKILTVILNRILHFFLWKSTVTSVSLLVLSKPLTKKKQTSYVIMHFTVQKRFYLQLMYRLNSKELRT